METKEHIYHTASGMLLAILTIPTQTAINTIVVGLIGALASFLGSKLYSFIWNKFFKNEDKGIK